MKPIIRWLLFFFIGYPFQLAVYVIYLFVHLYWRIFEYKKVTNRQDPVHQFSFEPGSNLGFGTRVDGQLLDNHDDHGAFTMYGHIQELGLSKLVRNGNFVRRYETSDPDNLRMVSGDVVVAWCFAATNKHVNLEKLKPRILESAGNYLKNLGTCSNDEKNNGWVSNRCNNFGINFCPDSEAWGIGQPMAGPQFYTNSCLFALASKFSLKWKIIFWIHWILMGGWYWMWSPVIYTKNKPVHYAKDITMKALWVHKFVFGNRWWIRIPMETITYKLSTHVNDLFYAILGKLGAWPLPESMNAFFSQKYNATSVYQIGDMNGFLPRAIQDLNEQAKGIQK